MTEKRTGVGHEIETALEEVLAHVRGEVALPGPIVDDPTADRIVALRKPLSRGERGFLLLQREIALEERPPSVPRPVGVCLIS